MNSRREGFTLLELLLTGWLMLLLAGLAAASVGRAVAASAIRQSRSDGLAALHRARQLAIALGTASSLSLEADGWTIRASMPSGDSTLIRLPAPSRYGVTVDGMATPLTFGAAGLATGIANRTMIFRRGGQEQRIVVSRLGRVR